MAQQNSFDIVSDVDRAEVTNAIHQTIKEVRQRFDFKGSSANVVLEQTELVLTAEDETKLRNMNDILQQKLVRRGVPLKALSYGNVDPAAGGTVRQHVQIQQGIPQEKAKEIVRFIMDQYFAPNVSVQEFHEHVHNDGIDPLKAFSEACRRELVSMHAHV